ncbi:MAG: TolC family protein [Pseudomonadota bacterium]
MRVCACVCMVAMCFFSITALGKEYRIHLVADGQSPWSEDIIKSLQTELKSLSDADLQLVLPNEDINFADWKVSTTARKLQEALNDQTSDIVIALGIAASDSVARISAEKPIIAANVLSPNLQGFPISENGASARENTHFLVANIDLITEIAKFQQMARAKNIALLVEESYVETLPFLQAILDEITNQPTFQISIVPIAQESIEQTVANIPSDVNAVFVLPQLQLTGEKQQVLIDEINKRKLPSYTLLGRSQVEAGYLLGTGLVPSSQQLIRRLAIDIRDIALGRSITSLPVALDVKDRLAINLATAQTIGFSPSFSVLVEANQINALLEEGRTLSLFKAVEEAVARNLDLALADTDVRLALETTKQARSTLLPQLSGNADWQALDRDLAISQQTRSTSVGLNLSQTIYSESQQSEFVSSKFLEKAQKAVFESTRLDIIELTALLYLDVLVAKTELAIQEDNLRLTFANLERAEYRSDIGAASRSDVLRFRTELGSDRQSVTDARSQFEQSINVLNQVLQRPITERFRTQEPGLSGPGIFGDSRLPSLLDTPRKVLFFSDYLTQEAIENSPEIESLKNEIASQERLLLATKRKRYVPDVVASADVSRVVADNDTPFTIDHDNNWSLGVEFSWTLYQGSAIRSEQTTAQLALQQLKLQQKQLLDSLESDTRNSVIQAGASRANIGFASDSADAALQTFDLVTDSYVRGVASYIDLIDAQSSYLNARLSAANAVYVHLQDLMSLQRTIGFFDFYVAPQQTILWFQSLEAAAIEQGIQL